MLPYKACRRVVALSAVLLLPVACGAPLVAPVPAPTSTPVGMAVTDPPQVAGVTAEPATTTAATSTPLRTLTPRTDQQAHNMTLVGALALESNSKEAYGDIARYENLAFIGTSHLACLDSGVPIIDISNPAQPRLLAHSPPVENVAMEDLDALRIGDRDVLAIGLQACHPGLGQATPKGLDLIDISEPSAPRRLSRFELPQVEGMYGVHEFDLTITPDGRALALLAVPDFELHTAQEDGRGGTGDLLIVDISDPTQPWQVAEWGLLDETGLGPAVVNEAAQGDVPATFLHSVRANADGTRALLSYWDAGVIILDISDPAAPKYMGRTTFAPDEEGNAHSIATSADGRVLVEAAEDFSPKTSSITSNAFTGHRAAIGRFPTAQAPDGDVVHAGRGCPMDTMPEHPAEDAYTREISGTIALLDPGGCRPEQKAARAQLAGAVGVILYGGETFLEAGEILQDSVLVTLPGGDIVRLKIAVLITSHRTAQDLIAAAAPARIKFTFNSDGWGGLRLFDISDPRQPVQLSSFRTANSDDATLPPPSNANFSSVWSVHNPEIRDKLLVASWYRDGVRAIDISDPQSPREVGFWTGKGAPSDAPPVDIWGIALRGDLVFASDRNFGLYVLTMQP